MPSISWTRHATFNYATTMTINKMLRQVWCQICGARHDYKACG